VRLSARARYAAPVARVAQILAESGFVRAWAEREAAVEARVSVTGAPPGPFTVSVRAELPVTDLPAQVRPLMPGGLDVRMVHMWEAAGADGERRGTVAIDIMGAPLRLGGAVALAPVGPRECEQRYTLELAASIPLFGARIEQAAVPVVRQALEAERKAMVDWLRRDGE
jgi:hypothetical protein